jgi:peptidoglycan/xylan/chitin deacetylase (PgdA/CDA1 family)
MDLITSSLLRFYKSAQRSHPEILYFGNPSRREIALTFDDGPHPRDTLRVLEVLAKHQVPATFFLIGRSAECYPTVVKQIHEQGHHVAIHGYRHLSFFLERPLRLQLQLDRARTILAEICGISAEIIKDLRPPYGELSSQKLSLLRKWGYRPVLWSCIPPHWMQPVRWSIHQVIDGIVPGTVIVLHDGHGHGTKVAEIVDAVVPRIQSLGFAFVTVEEMQNQRQQLSASSGAEALSSSIHDFRGDY